MENERLQLEECNSLAVGQLLLGACDQLLRGYNTMLDEQPLPALLFMNGRRNGDRNLRTLPFVVGRTEDGKATRAGRRRAVVGRLVHILHQIHNGRIDRTLLRLIQFLTQFQQQIPFTHIEVYGLLSIFDIATLLLTYSSAPWFHDPFESESKDYGTQHAILFLEKTGIEYKGSYVVA